MMSLKKLANMEREGKLVIGEDGMRLTDEGIDISNSIMALFV